ncbi:MAG: hypothetical protein IPI49_13000 [Myxococcales bacterium]|nr:hypothetical protein [Myxococcales bacterium]
MSPRHAAPLRGSRGPGGRRRGLPLGFAVALALLVISVLASTRASAETKIARGAVVKLEQQELYVTLGTAQGVTSGAPLRIKRPLRLRHPVSRAMIEDWVPVGSATVTQAGASLSRAVVGELIAAIKLGDLVEVLVEVEAAEPAPGGPSEPRPAKPDPEVVAAVPVDPATLEVLQVFRGQVGQPLEARIAGWEQFLSTRASSPYAAQLRVELDALRRLRDELSSDPEARSADVLTPVRHNARKRAEAGAPLALVFVLEQPAHVASAFLHYRARGARTFHSVLLTREYDRYLRGQIPGDVVAPPGVDYFVEVSAPSGRSGLAVGSPTEPIEVDVPSPPLTNRFGATAGRSSVKLSAEYLDFATFDRRKGDRTDHLFGATIDFVYRLPGFVEALGVGYGALSATGGYSNEFWDAGLPAPRTGFRYGYAEIEAGSSRPGQAVGVAARMIAGVGREGFGLGFEARVRVGPRDGTQLLLVARTLEEIGFFSDIRFATALPRDLRLGLSVGATDQPLQSDTAVKLGTELTWSGLSRLALSLRVSWQGREINHGGLGGGGSLGVSW